MYRMAWSHELTKAQKAILLIYCPWGCENILADHRNGYLLPKRCCNTNWLYQCSDVLCSGRGETTCRCPMDIKDKIAYQPPLTKYNMYRADPSQVADHRNG